MKSVGTRELQHGTRSVRERVRRGETLLWVDRGKPVAVIAPAPAHRQPRPWPDLKKRLADAREKVSQEDSSASALIYLDRD